MSSKNIIILLTTLWLFLGNTANANENSYDLPQVTVLAASSLAMPLTSLTRDYSKQHNIIVTTSFAGTAEQASKIEQGEVADIFISAHPFYMTELKQKGLIDVYSLTDLASNDLCLVTSSKTNFTAKSLDKYNLTQKLNYLNSRSIMVMGDLRESALGLYTNDVFEKLFINSPNSLSKIKSRIIPTPSAKNTLYLIAKGETSGIIYCSDAINNEEVTVLQKIDNSLHQKIIYQAAVVAGENMDLARKFLAYLDSKLAKDVFRKYGFAEVKN